MTRINILLSILFVTSFGAYSQVFHGVVRDQNTKQFIPFASIYIVDLEIGTIADSAGRFSLVNSLPKTIKVKFSASGYESKLLTMELTSLEMEIYLNEKHLDLDEVTISGTKGDLQKNNAIHIETRKLSDLNSISSTSLGEAIANIPGVYQASTGVGISKPVVRGMQGIRVVSLLNGLRIENQQWGGDHGMGITELGIGSVEVIKGPSSLLYGADALGGVIYFIDEPYAKHNSFDIGAKMQLESNTMGTSNQLWFKLAKMNYRFNLAGSYSSHADYQLPNGKYAANSRFKENGLKAAFGVNKNKWVMHVRYNYSNNRVGIPGHSDDSVVNVLDFQVNDQYRSENLPAQVFNNHFLSIDNKWFFKKNEFQILVGQTFNRLNEYEEKWTVPGIDMLLLNTLYSVRLKSIITDKLSVISGFQGMFQTNTNGEMASELLLPNSFTVDNGIYSIGYFQKGKWNLQGGGRVDLRQLESLETFEGQDIYKKNFAGFNFSAGAVRSSKSTTFRMNVSSGFRAPHLSELLANGFHHGALRYEIGDRNMIPEKATQVDFTMEIHGEHLELVVNPFYNYIQNYIAIQPIDSLIDDLPVFEYAQIPSVHLFGTDIGLHYHPHFAHWLHVESTMSLLKTETNDGSNLALMPQNRWSTLFKINLSTNGKWQFQEITFQHMFFARQNRITSFETNSADYQLLNASLTMKYNLKNPIFLNIGVKNILNEQYIDHLSRLKNIQLAHPGRNIYLSIKYNFNHQIKTL